ncbi:MAG: hemerythrin domain-containing protein [Desulfobacterales bacterium]|nr:hemerythrin domain-containing protein [Desulfobacterales bacterium]
MKVTDILMREHDLISRALENLAGARDQIESGQSPPKEFFEKALWFLREFADKFHHFKEEYLMFGLLALKKEGAFDSPIGALRYQHERCRKCLNEMTKALNGYADGDNIALTTLLENLAAYISLLRRHIHEEDYTFFQMAAQELSKEEEEILLKQFKKENEKMGGQKFYDKCRNLIDEMGALLNS